MIAPIATSSRSIGTETEPRNPAPTKLAMGEFDVGGQVGDMHHLSGHYGTRRDAPRPGASGNVSRNVSSWAAVRPYCAVK